MQLLDTIETLRAEEASVDRLYRGEGQRVRGRSRKIDPEVYREGLRLIERVFRGDRYAIVAFTEAMSTDDFPQIFGDVLDRQLLAGYQATPTTFQEYMRVNTSIRDFRDVKRFRFDGGSGALGEVPELTEYPEGSFSDDVYTYAVKKYGRRYPFSWETFVNDDLGAFREVIEAAGRAARRTEERFATDLFVGTNGPDGTFFAAGNGNIVTGNPVLSVASLQTAFQVLAAQTDTDGEPIVIDAMHLIVPPALEVTAMNILNGLQLEVTEQGGTANQKIIARNWMANRVQLHVNPYLPVLATNNKHTQWYLVADPANGRPWAEIGFLRGRRDPDLFIKDPNARRIGGGSVDPTEGDFDVDAVEYKVRHVLGGTLLDPKMAVASEGDGT